MITPRNGVWKEDGNTYEPPPGISRSAEFELAVEFFWTNVDDLHRPQNYAPALRWILTDAPHRFSFTWTCETLGIDAEAARDELLSSHLDPAKLVEKPRLLSRDGLCPMLAERVRNYIKNHPRGRERGRATLRLISR